MEVQQKVLGLLGKPGVDVETLGKFVVGLVVALVALVLLVEVEVEIHQDNQVHSLCKHICHSIGSMHP